MKQRSPYVITICILLLTNTVLFFRYRKLKKENGFTIVESEARLMKMKSLFKTIQLKTIPYQNFRIPDHASISDENGNRFFLRELVSEGKKLIFYFSELSCDICYNTELSKIKDMLTSGYLKPNQIIVLAKYDNQRYLNIFKRVNKLDFEIYNVEGSYLMQNNNEYPYYFILDSGLELNNLFVVSKDLPDLTKKYVENFLNKSKN